MPETPTPDEANLSKRERQKARRAGKQAAQAAEARKARTRRLIAFGALGVLLLGLVGAAALNFFNQRAAEDAARQAAVENLDEFGCSEITELPNNGAGHFTGDQLASSPPDVVYPDRPAASGIHVPNWALTGVYDKQIDERLLVHNLEHGYVVMWYDRDAPEADVQAMKAYASEQIDGDFEKIVVAEYPDELPEGNFTLLSWDVRQSCEQFSQDIAFNFLDSHHGLDSTGPEKTLAAHLEEGEGIDPTEVEGALLFPPLDGGDLPEGATEEPTDDGTAGDADDGEIDPEPTTSPTPAPTDT